MSYALRSGSEVTGPLSALGPDGWDVIDRLTVWLDHGFAMYVASEPGV